MDENAPSDPQSAVQPEFEQSTQPQQPVQSEQPRGVSPGVQHRIDELTAKWRTAQAQNEQLLRSVAEMTARMQAMEVRTQQPQQAAVDPLAKYADRLAPEMVEILNSVQQRTEQMMAARMRQFEATLGMQSIEQMARNSGVSPEVAQKAAQVYATSKAAGSTATPEEALRWAIGDAFLNGGGPRQAFGGATNPLPVQAQSPVPPNRQSRGVSYPPNWARMSPSEQAAFLEAAGVGDAPLD